MRDFVLEGGGSDSGDIARKTIGPIKSLHLVFMRQPVTETCCVLHVHAGEGVHLIPHLTGGAGRGTAAMLVTRLNASSAGSCG